MQIIICTRSSYPDGPSDMRRKLFTDVCARSLRAQTDSVFLWLLNVSADEDTTWRVQATKGLRIGFVHENWSRVLENFDIGPELRMVRLDDDDALARDFVERLRRVPWRAEQWCVFPVGYRACERLCAVSTHPKNQFVSFDVPPQSQRHVYEINHLLVPEATVVDDMPAWLWMRHNESKSRGGRGATTLPLSSLKAAFAVELK